MLFEHPLGATVWAEHVPSAHQLRLPGEPLDEPSHVVGHVSAVPHLSCITSVIWLHDRKHLTAY